MKLSSSPHQSSQAPHSRLPQTLKDITSLVSRFGARAALSASLLMGTACSDEVTVHGSVPADASSQVDSGRLGSIDAGQDAQSSGKDAIGADAQRAKLPCSPIPYCPNPKMSPATPWLDNLYLAQNRWFRVHPQTKEIRKICEPIKHPTCDAAKGEAPGKNNCDLPICDDATMCDPIPSRKSAQEPYFHRDFAPYPNTQYISSGFASFFSQSPYPNSMNPYTQPFVFDNVPDCGPGESPAGESYMSCDLIPTCGETYATSDFPKNVFYPSEDLPRCEPGEPVATFGKFEEMSLYDKSKDCEKAYYDTFRWISSSYRVSPWKAIVAFCDPVDNLAAQKKPTLLPTKLTINCLPIPACGSKEVPTWAPLKPLQVDAGLYGIITTSMEDEPVSQCPEICFAPSCEPIPSLSKK